MRSEHPNIVELEFYSTDREVVWPGDGQVFVLDDGESHSFPLQCESGETVCYGAWLQGDESTYWGAGPGGGGGCEDCCYICDGSETPERVITP